MSCPTCSKDTVIRYRPFCSKRCADIDLAKWFSGAYAIATTDPEDANLKDNDIKNNNPLPH